MYTPPTSASTAACLGRLTATGPTVRPRRAWLTRPALPAGAGHRPPGSSAFHTPPYVPPPAAGHLVSAFVKHHLPVVLMEDLTSGIAPGDALSRGFLAVDERLGASAIDCEFSGSTAVVAFLKVCWGRRPRGHTQAGALRRPRRSQPCTQSGGRCVRQRKLRPHRHHTPCAMPGLQGNELTTAWVGDSRAVLGRATPCGRSVAAVGLTEDHKPAAPGERERILRNQGRVERCAGRR